LLNQAGHDEHHVFEIGLRDADDAQVWDYAVRKGRAILTKGDELATAACAAFTARGARARLSAVNRITFNPNQCEGRPCIRGMRIPVKDVRDLLAAGVSEAEILADLPYLEGGYMRMSGLCGINQNETWK
jgi:uncharacterized protein (DUF433 family)